MGLFRIHAFEVMPQRKLKAKRPPKGGAFPVSKEITASLESLYRATKLPSQAAVDFRTDGASEDLSSRKHAMRDLVLEFLFGKSEAAVSAALGLASKLSATMDDRTPATLLLLTGIQGKKGHRQITMWAFPKDEAFQFSSTGSGSQITLLKNIFSRSSRLRKAALFEGKNRQDDFWSGRILDLQATGGLGKAADYWITHFLDCRLGLDGDAGTRLLVKHLRSAYDRLDSQEDRDQIYNSIVAVRTSPKRVWSLSQFADNYLSDEAKRVFMQSVPADLRQMSFRFRREEFEDKMNFRVFRLKDDVFVSAPFGAVGKSVQIEDGKDGEERRLSCEGVIVDEKVRARHA